MRVKEIKIQKFKHIQGLSLALPAGLTILIGKNNSGKSNVLEAIASLTQPVSEGDFDIDVELDSGPLHIAVHGGQARGNVPSASEKMIVHLRDAMVIPPPKNCPLGVVSREKISGLFSSLRGREPGAYSAFIRTLMDFFPGLRVNQDAAFDGPLVSTGAEPTTVTDLGAGFQQVFAILLALFHPQVSIVLIDEPEAHLHPSVISKLREVTAEAADKYGKQVIVSTHSPLFLTPRLLVRTIHLSRKRTTVMYTATRSHLDIERLEQELTPDVGEAFFADAVLMVEGVADKLIMRSLWDRFGQQRFNIKIIDVGGKGNFGIYRDLFAAFGIQYFTLVDRDALHDGSAPFVQERLDRAGKRQSGPEDKISFLQGQRIFVLPHGTLEAHYPKRFQNRDLAKPIAALHAGRGITEQEYHTETIELKRVIDAVGSALNHG